MMPLLDTDVKIVLAAKKMVIGMLSVIAFALYLMLFVIVSVDPSKRYLYLQVLGGKAFLEHLQDPEPIPGKVTSTFTLHVHFKGQRFKSRPVPCACEPDLTEGD